MMPSPISDCTASRIDDRPTPNMADSCCSVGSFSPSFSSPDRISAIRLSRTWSARLRASIGISPYGGLDEIGDSLMLALNDRVAPYRGAGQASTGTGAMLGIGRLPLQVAGSQISSARIKERANALCPYSLG